MRYSAAKFIRAAAIRFWMVRWWTFPSGHCYRCMYRIWIRNLMTMKACESLSHREYRVCKRVLLDLHYRVERRLERAGKFVFRFC
jgi:hypothetical protein